MDQFHKSNLSKLPEEHEEGQDPDQLKIPSKYLVTFQMRTVKLSCLYC